MGLKEKFMLADPRSVDSEEEGVVGKQAVPVGTCVGKPYIFQNIEYQP